MARGGNRQALNYPRYLSLDQLVDGDDAECASDALDQALAPPAGFVEVSTLPSASLATHMETDGQDMLTIRRPPSICVICQADDPSVGSVLVSTSPFLSTAAQNELAGRRMPGCPASRDPLTTRQAANPPAG